MIDEKAFATLGHTGEEELFARSVIEIYEAAKAEQTYGTPKTVALSVETIKNWGKDPKVHDAIRNPVDPFSMAWHQREEEHRRALLAATKRESGDLREAMQCIYDCAKGIMPIHTDMHKLMALIVSLRDARWTRLYAIYSEAAKALGIFNEIENPTTEKATPRTDSGLVEELAEALQFYADPKNWKLEIGYDSNGNAESVLPNAYFTDKGESARNVLAKYKTHQKAEGVQ